MNADERFERVRTLFTAAAALDEEARSAWLAEQCRSEPDLRREVQDLLDRAGALRSSTAGEGPAALLGSRPVEPALPTTRRIAGYEIVRVIGVGGMGVVYEAEQSQPRRKVALKLIRAEGYASERARRRFEFEGELLGRLQHPSITQIFEAGVAKTPEGAQPFLAMELVDGRALTTWCAEARPTLPQKLELFVELCSGVQHAHERGVVHRDLKPDNVLVQRDGRLKILDFGIASDVQGTGGAAGRLTQTGAIVGTLAYISPERLWDDARVVDTRSDVYSLGVMLYELVSGRLPHALSDMPLGKALTTMRTEAPAPPVVPKGSLFSDLTWIVSRAMHQDPTQRYESAAALGADVARMLRHEPILARPTSATYQLRQFARRHRAWVAGGVLVLLALLGGLLATLAQARIARSEQQNSRDLNSLYRTLFSSVDPEQAGRDVRLIDVLDQMVNEVRRQFADRPLVQAAAFDTLANTYASLGETGRAKELASSALETRTRELGEHAADTAESRHTLASILYDEGDLDSAELDYRTAYEDLVHASTGDERTELTYAHDLANCWKVQGKLPEAETLLRQTLERTRKSFGSEDDLVLTIENTLGNLLSDSGRPRDALSLLEDVLRVRQSRLPADNALVLSSINNVAAVHFYLGQFAQAEQEWRKLLPLREKALGEIHQDTLNVLNSLAVACRNQNKLADAAGFARRAAKGYETTLGPDERDTLMARNTLASILRREGKPSDGLAILDDILRRAKQHLAATDPLLSTWRLNAALCHHELGQWDAAEAMLKLCTDMVGPAKQEFDTAIERMSRELDARGEKDRAERLRAMKQ